MSESKETTYHATTIYPDEVALIANLAETDATLSDDEIGALQNIVGRAEESAALNQPAQSVGLTEAERKAITRGYVALYHQANYRRQQGAIDAFKFASATAGANAPVAELKALAAEAEAALAKQAKGAK